RFLNPGDAPEAEFKIDADQVTARAYCNLHGLWKA
ncbi:MAG: desulfoferrodoxin, partial [Deltaproteobacteria bacterium]|nr:desulfoferrodoxin [Deltaproteobacteria bacterium]